MIIAILLFFAITFKHQVQFKSCLLFKFKQLHIMKSNRVLPPGFQQLSKFKFGSLIIDINISELKELSIESYQFQFLGAARMEFILQTSQIQFDIKTSLWHFYSYLADMRQIQFTFHSSKDKIFKCVKNLNLQNSQNVFKKSYVKGSYLINPIELCQIHENSQTVGHVMVKTKLSFDQQVHVKVCQIVDFNSLKSQLQQKNVQQIEQSYQEVGFSTKFQDNSPLNRNPQVKANQKYFNNSTTQFQKRGQTNQFFRPFQNRQNQINFNNISKNPSEIKYVEEESNMEDQIDKLIAQMQNRPYDSSRYIDNLPDSQVSQFNHNQPPSRQNFHLSKTMSSVLPHRQLSKSPLQKKYPPMPVQNRSGYDNSQNMTTIYSQRSISPSNNNNRSLGKTHNLMHTKSLSNISLNSANKTSNIKGKLKINIHQLVVAELQQDSYILKIFLNDQFQQFYACKGTLQGEVILFNQKTKLKTYLNQIQKLKFAIYDWEDTLIGQAKFVMDRLIKIPSMQGIFMLNLYKGQQYFGETVVANQRILKKIQAPNHKAIRISLEYEQELQIVQIYLKISKINFSFKTCKYKIPFTKQTVQFEVCDSHFNVFPQNKDCNKLVIQFWSQKSIIGTAQINLNGLSNTSKTMMEMSIQPIYLYDSLIAVSDIFKQKQVGKFKLLMCFGNIRQIQHILNNQRTHNKKSSMKQKQKIEVNYEQKLGVFVKQRSSNKQIQIQVDPQQLSKDKNYELADNKYELGNSKQNSHKQSLQNQSSVSQNQFLDSKMNVSSRFHQLDLQQQEEDEQLDLRQKQDRKQPAVRQKQENQHKKQQKQSKKQIKQKTKQLKSLTLTMTKQIKNTLQCLWNNQQQNFRLLKNMTKKYLLYNFVEVPLFKNCLMELGITGKQIQAIIAVLNPAQDMINFNILSDLICSISLSEQVKPNLISDKLFSKYALEVYYRMTCQQIQNNIQNWLQFNVIQNIVTIDQNVQFNEMRAYFKNFDFKLSMSEFNIIIQYLQNLIKEKISCKQQKLEIISNLIKKHKEAEHQQKYQESILKKIYQNDELQMSLNDSKISEIHNQSRILNEKSQYQDDLDDIYIINQLNNHKNDRKINQQICHNSKLNEIKIKKQTSQNQRLQKQTYSQNMSFAKMQSSNQQVGKECSKKVIESLKESGKGIQKHKIRVQGIQSCKDSFQCQLDRMLQYPKISLSIRLPIKSVLYFNEQQTVQIVSSEQQFQQMEGIIELYQRSELLGHAAFVVMKNMKSMYTLRTIKQQVFCGLVSILIQ